MMRITVCLQALTTHVRSISALHGTESFLFTFEKS